jgi:uncharacterized membrane protein YqjE
MLFSIDFKNRNGPFALMKFVAWSFLATSLIGCFLFLLWIVGPDYRVVRVIASDRRFLPSAALTRRLI